MLKPTELATILVALQSLANRRRAGDPIPELSEFAALNSESIPLEDEIESLMLRLNAQAVSLTDVLWLSVPRPYAVLLPAIVTALGNPDAAAVIARQLEDYQPGSTREMYVAQAQAAYTDEGTLEFDDNAAISEGDAERGAYVHAWRWVEAAGVTREECSECGQEFGKSEMLPYPSGEEGLVCAECLADMNRETQELLDGQQPDGTVGEDCRPG